MPVPPLLGISAASYGARRFPNALKMLQHAHRLGAGGIQTGVRRWDAPLVWQLRDYQESSGLFIEGQISLPQDKRAVDAFEQQIARAKEAGVSVVRTVALSGRRYETFQSWETFREFKRRAWHSLTLAEPVMRKHEVSLAIENHKDWIIPELLDIVSKLSSTHIGVCLDTGNSISLLEDPMEVIEAYAPYTVTTHFKDMDFRPYEDGFLLSEVPLGEGILDLQAIIATCEKHRPGVHHNLEMVTRDPLKVPCLNQAYWATFASRAGRALAETLALVEKRAGQPDLPTVSSLSRERRIEVEEANVRSSLAYANARLFSR